MWRKIINITNPTADQTQLQHHYSFRNERADIQTIVVFFELMQSGDSDDLTLKFSTRWSITTFMRGMNLDYYPEFPIDRDDFSRGVFTIQTSDKYLIGYLINHLISLDRSFSSHGEALAGVLSINLTNAHRSFPAWIKTGSLESIRAQTIFRSRLSQCLISQVQIETKNTGEVHLRLTARTQRFDELARGLANSGCSLSQATHSFYISSGPGRYQGLAEFVAKLGKIVGADLDMPIAELMGSEPMSSFIETSLRAVFAPAYDAKRFVAPAPSTILKKYGYNPENMPDEYLDPLFKVFLDDPVIVPGCSQPCERSAIKSWLEKSPEKINPFTNKPGLEMSDLKPDNKTAVKINEFVGERVRESAEASKARESRCVLQ